MSHLRAIRAGALDLAVSKGGSIRDVARNAECAHGSVDAYREILARAPELRPVVLSGAVTLNRALRVSRLGRAAIRKVVMSADPASVAERLLSGIK